MWRRKASSVANACNRTHKHIAGSLRALLPNLLRLNATAQAAIKKTEQPRRHVTTFLADYFAVAQERGVPPMAEFPEI